jgi:hypothetical protein
MLLHGRHRLKDVDLSGEFEGVDVSAVAGEDERVPTWLIRLEIAQIGKGIVADDEAQFRQQFVAAMAPDVESILLCGLGVGAGRIIGG